MTTKSFDDLGLAPELLKGIHDLDYLHPTPIQEQSIPIVLTGRDVIGQAQTGTGKTAAFLLPILQRLMASSPADHKSNHARRPTRALVLAPTRELAQQSMDFLASLAKFTHLKGVSVYGGVGFEPQTQGLRGGADIVVATPGRLLDHMGRGNAKFENVEILVLDEADRMLDMGFLPDIRRILSRVPPKRQTLLFSATMPSEILQLTRSIMQDPQHVSVGQTGSTAVGITHAVYPVPAHLKTSLLALLLRRSEMVSVLVFTHTKRKADRVAMQLERKGYRVSAMHSERTQGQRMAALRGFKEGKIQVLVATDIVARGIDVEEISHVINYDVPSAAEDYIHRVGRTARAAAKGDAFTLMSPDEEGLLKDIEWALNQKLPRVTLPDFNYGEVSREGYAPERRPGGLPAAAALSGPKTILTHKERMSRIMSELKRMPVPPPAPPAPVHPTAPADAPPSVAPAPAVASSAPQSAPVAPGAAPVKRRTRWR